MAKSKTPRKKLLKEPDEFLSFSSQLLQQASAYKGRVLCVIGILFGILAIVSAIRFFSAKSENQASLLLKQTLDQYAQILPTKGPSEALKAVEPGFAQMLDRFSGKRAGKYAKIYFANYCYAAGNLDKAIEVYQQALNEWTKELAIRNLVIASLGYAYEKKNDLPAAARTFEMIQAGSDRVAKDMAIFNLGRIYAKLGETQKSQAAYKAVATDYPDSIYAQLAKEKDES
jgi:tetratricopeptide (TPR) repeat protein